MNTSVNSMVVNLSFFQWTILIVIIVALGMGFLGAVYYGIKAGFESIAIQLIALATRVTDTEDLASMAWRKAIQAHDRLDKKHNEVTIHQHYRKGDLDGSGHG